ncbi:MAG: sigma 54-interacting transcriptional regulator [Youngiibacter sp.]|nr:sigma 54-interacting transcriptional regulator [Youngiibacter sp.]
MFKIAFIAPSKEIEDIVRNTCMTQNLEMDVYSGLMEDGVVVAKKLRNMGYKVFISRGGTALELNREFPDHVIELKMALEDALAAIKEAIKFGNKIEFVAFSNHLQGFESLGPLLNLDISQTVLNKSDDVHKVIQSAIDRKVNAIIGGALQIKVAEELNFPCIQLRTSESAVVMAYNEAQLLLNVILDHERREKEVHTILDLSDEGFIAIDNQNKITLINHFATDLFRVSSEAVVGKNIGEVAPVLLSLIEAISKKDPLKDELINYRGRDYLFQRVPIAEQNEVIGAMGILKDTKKIFHEDLNVRRKLYERGLVAKYRFEDIIGNSKEMKEAKTEAKLYAGADSNILITGETGTGKELFAQSIHNESKRNTGPFMAINCASIPESILESELFGYVEGAFTGAKKNGKAGVFEMAKGGTIFLDEIAEIPINLQSKLLRVLQEKCVMRLGDDKIIPIDARVIAATNHNLIEDAREGLFRSDLYYRLSVLRLFVPSLKQRGDDVIVLAQHFLTEYLKDPDEFLSGSVQELLINYNWPGNVRELQNLMERISIIGVKENTSSVVLKHISESSAGLKKPSKSVSDDEIEKALKETGGNVQLAADKLGINRTTIWRRLNNKK